MSEDFPFEEDADIGDVSDHTFGAIVEGETDVAEFKGLGAQGGCFTRGVRTKELTRAH